MSCLFVAFVGCGPSSSPSSVASSGTSGLADDRVDAPGDLVLYVAHDRIFSDPILEGFRSKGRGVQVVGDTEASKTTGLFQRLVRLRQAPEADVFWNNEVVRTVQLARLGMLESYLPASAVGIPAEHCDPSGRWVGFGARARVILYNTDLLPAAEAPRSIHDLTKPALRGRVAIANPLFGTTASHVAALFAALGEDKGRAFLKELRQNDVRLVAGNAHARNLVMNGEIAVCLTDTDDANGALLRGKPVAMVYPDQKGLGTLVIPNTVSIIKGGPHPEMARRLVEYLASSEVEQLLARSKSAQMPLRDDLTPPGPRFDLKNIRRMDVTWDQVADFMEASTRAVEEILLR